MEGKTEAEEKDLIYVKVNANNRKQIEDVSLQEREGFGTGLDPQELSPALRFVARHGNIWLQHASEEGQKVLTGVIEFIPLEAAKRFNPNRYPLEDLTDSPLKIIMENEERIFRDVRRFASDKKIIYHHGIAMSRKEKGYGTLLLKYALDRTDGTVVCFIDGAQLDKDSNELKLAPNEISYALHMKAGFFLVGVADIPVYDDELIYYCFIRPAENLYLRFYPDFEEILNLADGDAKSVIEDVRRLTSEGYFGVDYNHETHAMTFMRGK